LPAAGSGVVGIHSTPGLVPQVFYDEPRLPGLTGSTGPLCRSVVDAAISLQVMAGPDGRDFTCTKVDPPDFSAHLNEGVEGMRFAWTDDFGFASMYAQDISPRVIGTVREAALSLKTIGAEVEAIDHICDDFWEDYVTTNYLFQVAMVVPRPSVDRWAQALNGRQRTWSSFRRVLADKDLLLCPTMQLLPLSIEDWGRAWVRDAAKYPHGTFVPTYTCYTHMFNWLAFPAMSVPCGHVNGLPVGLQIVGLPGSEDKMLRVANAFQLSFPSSPEHCPIG